MAIDGDGENTRVTVSLSTLRAELSSLELRLVDRLNGALQNKADRAIVEQHTLRLSDNSNRIQALEQTTVKRDGPIVNRVENIETELTSLKELSKYKKYLWMQTIALAAIALPLVTFVIDHTFVH